jgi:hypothetical protein
MAAKKNPTSKPATSNSTAIVKWDEELAKQAKVAAGMEESTAVGQFFSVKGGVLTWNDSPIQGNQLPVIIADAILENVYYKNEYDPENPEPPTCFAFGREESLMQPHKVSVECKCAQADTCKECEWNEWGTARKGRGKACKNVRRLAMIAAGILDTTGKFTPFEDPEEALGKSTIGYFRLPVTSVKGYAAHIKSITNTLKYPPHAVISKMQIFHDPDTQFKATFSSIMKVPKELLPIVMQRHEEAMSLIDFPYAPYDEEALEGQRQRMNGRGRGRDDRASGSRRAPAKAPGKTRGRY